MRVRVRVRVLDLVGKQSKKGIILLLEIILIILPLKLFEKTHLRISESRIPPE